MLRLSRALILLFVCYSGHLLSVSQAAEARPNILWITSEDHGIEMGCYGDPQATTPNVDALAAKGMRYRFAWSCAPVCAPARTTLITGRYATSLGAEHMRSMVTLPADTHLFPRLLRSAGYYCCNHTKEDYNVSEADGMPAWDASNNQSHWRNRKNEQPFFAVFNSTRSHESSIRNLKGDPQHSPDQMRIPRYHPDTPEVRRDWAIYYDSVSQADQDAGKVLRQLEADGLSESTIVFYFGDHGSGMPRRKRWAGNSGLRVPLIIYIPERFKHLRPDDYTAGGESNRLVSFVDFAPTVLNLADVEIPKTMEGRPFLGSKISPAPSFVLGFRGRMDERTDFVRSVSNGRFVYIRNFMTHISAAQHVAYQFETPTTAQWKQLFDEGKCNAAQAAFWTAPRPAEELYDLTRDPDEVHNVIDDPEHQAILFALRSTLITELERIKDPGCLPEGMRWQSPSNGSLALLPLESQRWTQCYEAAWQASLDVSQSSDSKLDLTSLLMSPDAVVRYWGSMGLIMQPNKMNESIRTSLVRIATNDPSPFVQVAACHALWSQGDDTQQRSSVEHLLSLVENTDNWFVAMQAIETLDQMNATSQLSFGTDRLTAALRRATALTPPHSRYDSYIPRLVESLQARQQ